MQDKAVEIAFFDAITRAADYEVLAERGYERILKEFRRYLPPRRPLRVVDLGCGSGAFTKRLAPFGLDLYGVDLSGRAIELAAQLVPGLKASVGDIERTGFADGAFDVVILSGVLHHFPDLSRVVRECARLLAPGGLVLAYDPHRHNPFMWVHRCKSSPLYSSQGVTENEEPLARRTIAQAFRGAGFSSVDVYPISGVSFRFVEGTAGRFVPIYNALDRLLDVPPLRRLGSFLITAARR